MDENTRMMIQLASMMMQNQNAMREVQQEMETPTQSEGLNLSKDRKGSPVSSASSGSPDLAAAAANGVLPLGMDPQLMAEFARQIVMNANHSIPPPGGKRSPADKPTTIAQMIQSQALQNMTSFPITTSASSEGKIFVYNRLPEEDPSLSKDALKSENFSAIPGITDGVPLIGQSDKRNGSNAGPIRNKYGRVLRPGIDNFGSFEAVANPGLIMQAMELMRQKDKKKRGPKEKETFSVFIYCLPDKNSKLPKFSSLDPMERSLVDQHQGEGYGYPSQDYINGIPRKTQLCLGYSEEKFRSFMITLYPKLEGRFYDMYRIDKTRRLIRVHARSPRQLKDMKYQGSVIVIPYDKPEEQPAPIIHRNFDECYNGGSAAAAAAAVSLGNPLAMIQNFNIPLPGLPELVGDAPALTVKGIMVKPEVAMFANQARPAVVAHSRKSKACSPEQPCKSQGQGQQHEAMDMSEKDVKDINGNHDNQFDNGSHDNGQYSNGNQLENASILNKVAEIRNALNPHKRIHIRPETLFVDMLNAYRNDKTLETFFLTVCFQQHQQPEPEVAGAQQHDEDNDIGSLFVMFWEEAFRKHFSGQQDMVPVIEPGMPEDLFEICGRILLHGLILENYLPLKLSSACLAYVFSGNCSDKLLLTSFYRCMSESEMEVLENCKDEIRYGAENFSSPLENSLRIVLGSYGCRNVPRPYELETRMTAMAKSYLIQQPYWALQQLQEGVRHCGSEEITCCSEQEVVRLYTVLSPNVPRILDRVIYIHSADKELAEKERAVRTQFESYVYKLSKPSIPRLLYQWCGFDCLCVANLFVKFSGSDELGSQVFCPKQATICLPSATTSVEEVRAMLENHLPATNIVDL